MVQTSAHHGIASPPVPGSGAGKLIVAFAGVIACAGVGFSMLLASGGSTPPVVIPTAPGVAPVSPVAPSAPQPPEPPSTPVPPAVVVHLLERPLLVLDVDGDHHAELVAGIERTVGSDSTEHYGIFDARTGALRAFTQPIDALGNTIVAGLGNRLVVAESNGQVTGHDLVSGDRQWSTTLGERVSRLCDGGQAGVMQVETDAERTIALDLTTGRQSESRPGCGALLAKGDGHMDPRDRADHDAPRGVEAYRCGGVTVMGSANYRVADQCQARGHVDTDRLEGMVGHRIWKLGRGWLVFGVRKPGAYVPMVGRLERGAFVWKSEVPASNPLEAEEGGPRYVALVGETLVLIYSTGPRNERHPVATAFGVADGARRWTVPIPGADSVSSIVALDDAVAVANGPTVTVLSIADGATRATIGQASP